MASFGGMKPSVDMNVLRRLHQGGDYSGLVHAIKDHLELEVNIRVVLVNPGGSKDAPPAWISLPKPMPIYGTREFKHSLWTVYLQTSMLEDMTTEVVSVAIAHELSHIVLESTEHALKNEEKAVDLTAMILGFARAYFVVRKDTSGMRYGYLDADELEQVRLIMPRDTFGDLCPPKPAAAIMRNLTPTRACNPPAIRTASSNIFQISSSPSCNAPSLKSRPNLITRILRMIRFARRMTGSGQVGCGHAAAGRGRRLRGQPAPHRSPD